MDTMRWDIINYLINKYDYSSYLEIGYYKGWCFDNVRCTYKTAVDPNPVKNIDQVKMEYGGEYKQVYHNEDGFITNWEHVIKMTSDDFFKIKNNYTNHTVLYDIIFIDGLHKASQVHKDITNSLKYLSTGGIVLLHDMNPPTFEHTTTGVDGNWNGDCYKALLRFIKEDELGLFDICTIDTDWGIGVIKKKESPGNPSSKFELQYEKAINDWDYFDKNRKEILNLISVKEFKERF